MRNTAKYKEYQKGYNKRTNREYKLLKKYGISALEYENILHRQNYCCGICGIHMSKLKRSLFVDHDHTTGTVRGLLCYKCNTGIGALGDSIIGIEKALNYLKETM